MTDVILDVQTYNFIIDADQSSITMNSLNDITLNSVSGNLVLSGFGAGYLHSDADGILSSVAGSLFDPSVPQTISAAWNFSSTFTLSGLGTQASVLGVSIRTPPSGYSIVVMSNTTGQLYRMT